MKNILEILFFAGATIIAWAKVGAIVAGSILLLGLTLAARKLADAPQPN